MKSYKYKYYWSKKRNACTTIEHPDILAELQILDDDYYRAISTSKDEGFELHLKRKPKCISKTISKTISKSVFQKLFQSVFQKLYFKNYFKVYFKSVFQKVYFKNYFKKLGRHETCFELVQSMVEPIFEA